MAKTYPIHRVWMTKRRRGAAMLVILFMVITVAAIVAGVLYRSDLAAVSQKNYTERLKVDYLLLGLLAYAQQAVKQNPENPIEQLPLSVNLQDGFLCRIVRLEKIADSPIKTYQVVVSAKNLAYPAREPAHASCQICYDLDSQTVWLTDFARTP